MMPRLPRWLVRWRSGEDAETDQDDGFRDPGHDEAPGEGENADDDSSGPLSGMAGGSPEGYAATRTPHLYWTAGMSYPTSFGACDMTWDETETVAGFLYRLAVSVQNRGVLLDSNALMRLAEDINPVKASAILTEPWMTHIKRKASDAIGLGRAVTEMAIAHLGFARLVESGLPPSLGSSPAELEERVFAGDRHSLLMLADTLRRISSPLGETMAASLDYVLACLGERGAMVRVSDKLAMLARVDVDGRPFLEGHLRDEAVVSADTWRRLAFADIRDRSNAFDLVSLHIAPARIDLLQPEAVEKNIPGIVLPPQGPDARAAAASVSRVDRSRLRRMAGAAGIQIRAQTGMPGTLPLPVSPRTALVADQDKRDEADPASAANAPEPGAGTGPAQTVYVSVLDGIVGGDIDKAAERTYGHLLEPMPVIRSPDPDFLYQRLQREFPWMEEANAKAAFAAALSFRHVEGGFRLAPLVLVGPPGSGKSRWVRRLAALCEIPMHPSSLAGLTSTKSVIGSERGWANARPSLPALAFTSARIANPVILVDEADKAEAGSDVVSSFLTMLERETATRYPDIYLLGNLDLSRVSFVFTANSLSRFSQPFLDRVAVVNVPRPGPKEFPGIVNAIISEAMSDYSLDEDGFGEATEAVRADALKELEGGGSIRRVNAAVRKKLSKLVWAPPQGLKLVQ